MSNRPLEPPQSRRPAAGHASPRHRVLPRLLVAALAFAAGTLGPTPRLPEVQAQGAPPRLYVYLHTDLKSAALGKLIQERLPGLDVTVFGRYGDFEQAMETRPPDAVLALQPVLIAQGVAEKVVLQGERAGRATEPHLLVFVNPEIGHADLRARTVGALDLLGRLGTERLVRTVTNTDGVKVKRVTKMEDLLSLLQLLAADAVIVPASAVASFRQRSRLDLLTRELPNGSLGLAAVSVLNPATRESVVRQVLGLDAETKNVLGIERWTTR